MPKKQKIDYANVNAALETPCPKCGYLITPVETRRVDFERVECPKCRERFIPGTGNLYELRGDRNRS
jgi:predicted RNA-binding Zn-ribbon protein involved in translation (DUF1610 family)